MAVTGTGFLIDACSAYIENTDGNYQLVTATAGEVKFGGDNLEISAGQGFYPLARINTKRSVEVSLTDARLSIDSMQMAGGGTVTKNVATTEYKFGIPYTVNATTHSITIPEVTVASSVRISGLTETTSASPTATQFKVTVNASDTTILFNTTLDNTIVYPKYEVAKTGATVLTVKTDSFPKSALCVVKFPLYDDSTIDSSITQICQLTIFKAQIKPDFTLGGQYKNASTFKLDLYGLDARRSDSKMFDIQILPIA